MDHDFLGNMHSTVFNRQKTKTKDNHWLFVPIMCICLEFLLAHCVHVLHVLVVNCILFWFNGKILKMCVFEPSIHLASAYLWFS